MSKNLTAGQKRKYLSSGGDENKKSRYNNKWKPKRGGPGLLLTCETGRERKCMNEVIEILEYYDGELNDTKTTDEGKNAESNVETKADTSTSNSAETPHPASGELSLDDEIKLLQSQNNSKDKKGRSKNSSSSNWGLYDTGCKGTVYLLRTTPGCSLIPNIRQSVEEGAELRKKITDNDKNEKEDIKSKEENLSENDKNDVASPPESNMQLAAEDEAAADYVKDNDEQLSSPSSEKWDPIETYKSIITDLNDTKRSRNIPSSRFVTRIIPIEATCFANMDEIKSTTRALLTRASSMSDNNKGDNKISNPASSGDDGSATAPTTFAIEFKKRLCTTVTKEDIINNVAQIVVDHRPNWKVNLSKPDITILIQVCKTLCGISIIRHTKYPEFQRLAPNFNVVALREKLQEEEEKA